MEITSIISAISALFSAIALIWVGVSTRHKQEGEAVLSISQAAKNLIEMREADIKRLNKKVDDLFEYVQYLCAWIDGHTKSKERPMTFDDFICSKDREIRKSPAK